MAGCGLRRRARSNSRAGDRLRVIFACQANRSARAAAIVPALSASMISSRARAGVETIARVGDIAVFR